MPNAGVGILAQDFTYLYKTPVRCTLNGSVVKIRNCGSGCLGSNLNIYLLLAMCLGLFCASVSSHENTKRMYLMCYWEALIQVLRMGLDT